MPVGEFNQFSRAIDYLREPISGAAVRRSLDDPGYLQRILRDFAERLEQVRADPHVARIADQVIFRLTGGRAHKFSIPVLNESLFYSGLTITAALELLKDTIDALPLEFLLSEEVLEPQSSHNLSKVLPSGQVPAPAQFTVELGRLKIFHQPARPEAEDVQTVSTAAEEILKNGNKIIDELSRSNCDPRLIDGFAELQDRLASREDVIRTGITNITCTHLFERFKSELPDALYGMMQGHSVSVSMYVAQFPEWRRFADQAATANLDAAHAPHIAAAVHQIAKEIDGHPDIADPEVPRLLRLLAELVSDPKKASKRAIFAALRTLENLVWSAYSYAKDLLNQTAAKTVGGLSTAAARIIIVVVAGAILLGPVASSLPEVAWVQKATEIVIQELRARGIGI